MRIRQLMFELLTGRLIDVAKKDASALLVKSTDRRGANTIGASRQENDLILKVEVPWHIYIKGEEIKNEEKIPSLPDLNGPFAEHPLSRIFIAHTASSNMSGRSTRLPPLD